MSKFFRTLNTFMVFILCSHAPLDPRCRITDLGVFMNEYGAPIMIEYENKCIQSDIAALKVCPPETRKTCIQEICYLVVEKYISDTLQGIDTQHTLTTAPTYANKETILEELEWIKIRNAALVSLFLQNKFNEDPRLADVFDYIDVTESFKNVHELHKAHRIFGEHNTERLLTNSYTFAKLPGDLPDIILRNAKVDFMRKTRADFFKTFIERYLLHYVDVNQAMKAHIANYSMPVDPLYFSYFFDLLLEHRIRPLNQIYTDEDNNSLEVFKEYATQLSMFHKKSFASEKALVANRLLTKKPKPTSAEAAAVKKHMEELLKELLQEEKKGKPEKCSNASVAQSASAGNSKQTIKPKVVRNNLEAVMVDEERKSALNRKAVQVAACALDKNVEDKKRKGVIASGEATVASQSSAPSATKVMPVELNRKAVQVAAFALDKNVKGRKRKGVIASGQTTGASQSSVPSDITVMPIENRSDISVPAVQVAAFASAPTVKGSKREVIASGQTTVASQSSAPSAITVMSIENMSDISVPAVQVAAFASAPTLKKQTSNEVIASGEATVASQSSAPSAITVMPVESMLRVHGLSNIQDAYMSYSSSIALSTNMSSAASDENSKKEFLLPNEGFFIDPSVTQQYDTKTETVTIAIFGDPRYQMPDKVMQVARIRCRMYGEIIRFTRNPYASE